MFFAAALVPDTALLVPGVAGAADPVPDLRRAALDAVAEVVRGARRVVVVAPGRRDRELRGTVRGAFGSVGVPDTMLAWPVPVRSVGDEPGLGLSAPGPDEPVPGDPVPGVGTSVALHLLARVGWAGPLRTVEVTPGGDLAGTGRRVVSDDAVAMVVVGSGSGRHGPDAPLADDERAPTFDAHVLAALAEPSPAARAWLAGVDPGLAGELAVSGWAPWQVLLAAVGEVQVDASLRATGTPSGAQHAVVVWSAGGPPGASVGAPAG